MTNLTRNGVTVHVLDPLCSRVLRRLTKSINQIPAPKCWLC